MSYTTEMFIERAVVIHGNKYDYSLVEYVNSKTKVKIICPNHGVFEQFPTGHLQGNGCFHCGNFARLKYHSEFMKRSNKNR